MLWLRTGRTMSGNRVTRSHRIIVNHQSFHRPNRHGPVLHIHRRHGIFDRRDQNLPAFPADHKDMVAGGLQHLFQGSQQLTSPIDDCHPDEIELIVLSVRQRRSQVPRNFDQPAAKDRRFLRRREGVEAQHVGVAGRSHIGNPRDQGSPGGSYKRHLREPFKPARHIAERPDADFPSNPEGLLDFSDRNQLRRLSHMRDACALISARRPAWPSRVHSQTVSTGRTGAARSAPSRRAGRLSSTSQALAPASGQAEPDFSADQRYPAPPDTARLSAFWNQPPLADKRAAYVGRLVSIANEQPRLSPPQITVEAEAKV